MKASVESRVRETTKTPEGIGDRLVARIAAERIGVAAIGLVTVLAAIHILWGGMLIGQDSATQFYPWYSYLGERLRAGEFPGWNSAQFSGAPFAADPQSGWMYIPAMAIFTILPLALAAPVFVIGHLLLAAAGAYALGRVLGMPVIAASVAAVAYELTGPVYSRSVCCPAALEVSSWVPVALVGASLAVGARSWLGRLGSWTLSGFALSQVLAAWLGQGSYYLLLAVGAFVVYRAVLAPMEQRALWSRIRRMFIDAAAIYGIGFGLAAAGMIPRLAYVGRSNVAGGEYAGQGSWAAVVGGAVPGDVFDRLLMSDFYYPGVATLALALLALPLARLRFGTPFFFAVAVLGMVLSAPRTTPLHAALYAVLPRFETLHSHWPERIMLVVFIAPAMLAGSVVAELCARVTFRRALRLGLVSPLALVVVLGVAGAGVPWRAIVAVAAGVGLLWLATADRFAPSPMVRRGLLACLVVVISADLLLAGRTLIDRAPYGGYHRVDLEEYFGSTGAATFLEAATADEPARFFGYDPDYATVADGYSIPYRYEFGETLAQALIVNNRATLFGLDDVQGYNPVQPQRYVDYLTALNGHGQEYHDANIFSSGLDSPMLDLLNARFIIVPNDYPPNRGDLRDLRERLPTVYQDAQVAVLENESALPRAWVVFDARQAGREETLDALAAEAFDPRRVAILDAPPPPLPPAAENPAAEVRITSLGEDAISVTTQSSAPGMLVLSEVFDPDWRSTVNGTAATIYRANFLFRAIPIPAGTATIVLTYEARLALIGGAISGATVLAILGAAALLSTWPDGWRGRLAGGRRRVALR